MTSRQDIKLSVLLAKLIQQIIILDRNEKACQGVTLSQHYTIEALLRNRAMTMKELSREMNLATSTLTRIIDILVRDGLVKRKTKESDRRIVIVELTETGIEKADRLRECTRQFWKNILHEIPENKKPDLAEQVQLLLEAMRKIDGSCLDTDHQKTVSEA
jgi:MarR family transcriptional regulator, organic hydroperoxide resistance regulator